MMATISYMVGLDLGQAGDFTALSVLERTRPADPFDSPAEALYVGQLWSGIELAPVAAPGRKRERNYAVRHLERFPLGTSYPAICARVVELFAEPPLKDQTLIVDETGVGRAVVDMIRRARPRASIRPITITAGHAVQPEGAGWHVPKKELVSVLQVLLQSRRLQVARSLPLSSVLVKELENFRVKITPAAHETFEAWRQRDHDDMVLSVALAAWVGEQARKQLWVSH
jgi:hypothetical protein